MVSEVAFGAWAIGGWWWGPSDDEAALAALAACPEHGCHTIDTAPVYGFGHSEELVGRAIAGRREEYVLLSKCGLRWDSEEGEPFFESADAAGRKRRVFRNLRPDSIRLECERSLQRLGVDAIDLYQLHWPDPTTPVEDSLGACAELVAEGKVRAVGVSNFDPALLERARAALAPLPLAVLQSRYSLVFREEERSGLPWVREAGVGFLAYSPLAQGLLSGKVGPERRFPAGDERSGRPEFAPANRARIAAALESAILPAARAHDATPAQIALAWTAAQDGVSCVLAGARDARQVAENAQAGSLQLTRDQVDSIDRAFQELGLEL